MASKPLCRYYANGYCKNGSSCAFLHEDARDRDSRSRKRGRSHSRSRSRSPIRRRASSLDRNGTREDKRIESDRGKLRVIVPNSSSSSTSPYSPSKSSSPSSYQRSASYGHYSGPSSSSRSSSDSTTFGSSSSSSSSSKYSSSSSSSTSSSSTSSSSYSSSASPRSSTTPSPAYTSRTSSSSSSTNSSSSSSSSSSYPVSSSNSLSSYSSSATNSDSSSSWSHNSFPSSNVSNSLTVTSPTSSLPPSSSSSYSSSSASPSSSSSASLTNSIIGWSTNPYAAALASYSGPEGQAYLSVRSILVDHWDYLIDPHLRCSLHQDKDPVKWMIQFIRNHLRQRNSLFANVMEETLKNYATAVIASEYAAQPNNKKILVLSTWWNEILNQQQSQSAQRLQQSTITTVQSSPQTLLPALESHSPSVSLSTSGTYPSTSSSSTSNLQSTSSSPSSASLSSSAINASATDAKYLNALMSSVSKQQKDILETLESMNSKQESFQLKLIDEVKKELSHNHNDTKFLVSKSVRTELGELEHMIYREQKKGDEQRDKLLQNYFGEIKSEIRKMEDFMEKKFLIILSEERERRRSLEARNAELQQELIHLKSSQNKVSSSKVDSFVKTEPNNNFEEDERPEFEFI